MPQTIDITVPDLSGRRALITGASDGVGLEIAKRLARAGAELVLPVRNQAKGRAAAEQIAAAAPGVKIDLRELDLSALASVRALTSELVGEG
jgi:NAD(P)-dependent dehydrogenase (short-subunit alcohol dehydrogenase family)